LTNDELFQVVGINGNKKSSLPNSSHTDMKW
jgi:hypothetical protein